MALRCDWSQSDAVPNIRAVVAGALGLFAARPPHAGITERSLSREAKTLARAKDATFWVRAKEAVEVSTQNVSMGTNSTGRGSTQQLVARVLLGG